MMKKKYGSMNNCFLVLLILFCPSVGQAREKVKEREYQKAWCKKAGGIIEAVQSDRTRVDCLTFTHAIEFDFGKKWHEAIGQSLHYQIMSGKRAGVVLIIESEKDMRYWERMNRVIERFELPITTWKMERGRF